MFYHQYSNFNRQTLSEISIEFEALERGSKQARPRSTSKYLFLLKKRKFIDKVQFSIYLFKYCGKNK
jgi:hypothetical protein